MDETSRQMCPNCEQDPVRPVFTIAAGNRVVECAGCKLQFAEVYPEYDNADAEIYDYGYFEEAIARNAPREKVFARLLDEIEGVLGGKGRLLDVGAGEGTLLKVAAERGWHAEGTELSSAMVAYVRDELGLTMHQGILEDMALPPTSFDAIVLNHVLEHVKNPGTTLVKIRELLKPSGVVRIEVPNLASLSSRVKNGQSRMHLKKDRWKHYSTDHHFWFFTPPSLARTVDAAGLSLITMRAPAKQWGEKGFFDRLTSAVYAKRLWGGHLAAYARPRT